MDKHKIDFQVDGVKTRQGQYTWSHIGEDDAVDYKDKDDLKYAFRSSFDMNENKIGEGFDAFWEQVEKLEPNQELSFKTIEHLHFGDLSSKWFIRRNF